MKHICHTVLVMVCLALVAGCAMLAGSGISDSAALKTLIVREAQKALLDKQGIVMSEKDLGIIYDESVKLALSPEAAAISEKVEANEAATAKIAELLEKYLPTPPAE